MTLLDIGLDVSTIHKYHPRRKVSGFCDLLQDPVKDLVHGFRSETAPEVIADSRKVRRFLLNAATQKPMIIYIIKQKAQLKLDFFDRLSRLLYRAGSGRRQIRFRSTPKAGLLRKS